MSAIFAERGCGDCAARCGGRKKDNCADGLDILRAVLAAGVREALSPDAQCLSVEPLSWTRYTDEARRNSSSRMTSPQFWAS